LQDGVFLSLKRREKHGVVFQGIKTRKGYAIYLHYFCSFNIIRDRVRRICCSAVNKGLEI
jgi:hypothetical protein